MSKKFIIVAAAAITLSTFAMTGFAEARGHRNMDNMPKLTTEQKVELQSLREEHLKEIDPMHVELAAKRAEFRAVMSGDNPSPKEASRLAAELEVLEQNLRNEQFAFGKEISEKFDIPMEVILSAHNKGGKHHKGGNMHQNGKHRGYHKNSNQAEQRNS